MHHLQEYAALAFLRGYSQMEGFVVLGLVVVAVCLLGLMSNAILLARGFGIFGNAFLIALGVVVAVIIHDWLSRQPDFNALALPDRAIIVALVASCSTVVLLGAAYAKRSSAT